MSLLAQAQLNKEHSAGVEPDACFYIQNYQSMIGRRRIHPDAPFPDTRSVL